MSIDVRLVRTLASCLDKRSPCNSNSHAVLELAKLIKEITTHLEMSTIEKACNWVLEQNRWLVNEHKLVSVFNKYSRGDIIRTLDFGTSNIGTEHRYPHPAVVIYDQEEEWVVVAPITAAQLDSSGQLIMHPPFEVLVRKQIRPPKDPNEFYFTKDSIIEIDQLRRVSKYRVVNPTRYKLRLDVLNLIDNIMLENFIPKKHNLLSHMITLNKSLEDDIQVKDKRISDLLKSLEDAQSELQAHKLDDKSKNKFA